MRRAYVNGVIYTMKEENDVCSAFVEEDGNFIYCGTDEEAARIADVVIDLNGKTVLPGLTDTHQHLLAYSRDLHKLNLKDVTSAEELKQRIREKASTLKKGEWIQGAGFDNEKFTDCKDMPTKHLLDEAAPDNPVLLTRYCLHINVANSLALEAGGVDRDFVPEVDGTVGYDPDGEPNGIVLDQVAADISALIPDPNADYESQKKAVEDACRELNKVGLIGVHPIQAKHIDLFEKMSIYQDLEKEGRLTARVYLGLDEPPGMNMRRGLGSSMVKYGFYKLFTDGSLGARSAYLKEPYTDDPSQIGVTIYSQEELDRKVREGYEADLQVGVHVIGDRSVEMLVEAIEKAYYANPKPNVRFRMIHMSLLNDDIHALGGIFVGVRLVLLAAEVPGFGILLLDGDVVSVHDSLKHTQIGVIVRFIFRVADGQLAFDEHPIGYSVRPGGHIPSDHLARDFGLFPPRIHLGGHRADNGEFHSNFHSESFALIVLVHHLFHLRQNLFCRLCVACHGSRQEQQNQKDVSFHIHFSFSNSQR